MSDSFRNFEFIHSFTSVFGIAEIEANFSPGIVYAVTLLSHSSQLNELGRLLRLKVNLQCH